jgi:arylsulfatase A-like enzyme
LIEYNDGGRRLGFAEPARVRSVVTKDWRYSVYRDQDWGELYDLKSDPKETNNLWDDPAQTKTRAYFAERLNNHLIAQMDESPLSDRIA